MEKTQELWHGGPRLTQRDDVFPLCMDAVLLADFAAFGRKGTENICELGCGCGIISLLLALALSKAHIDAVDISAPAAELAALNIEQNGLQGLVSVALADMRGLSGGDYGLIVCNPPYFRQGGGRGSASLALARSERECEINDVCSAARRIAKRGAALCVVYRPERLAELLETMKKSGFEPKRLRFVHHSAAHKPCAVLCEGKLGAKPGLNALPPLLIHGDSGRCTEEFLKIYKMEENAEK